MMISNRAGFSIFYWLRAAVLLLAAVVLPRGSADAQDYGAVEKRLATAVVKGELSLRQASAMMDTLHEEAEDEEDWDLEEALRETGAELKAAVARGEMSEAEAWQEWEEFKMEEVAPWLKEAVHSGEMSKAKAWGLWKGIEKAEQAERLKAVVAKGEMTAEEARAKWEMIEQGEQKQASSEAAD